MLTLKHAFMSSIMLLMLLSVVSAAPVAHLTPITPVLPLKQTVRGQLGVVLITDEVTGVRYVTTLDRTGGRVAKSWPQAVFGVDRLSSQNRRLATWFTHKEQPEVTRLVGLLPGDAFRGVSDVRGAQYMPLSNKSPGAYVNGVFSEAAFNKLDSMGLSGQESLQLTEQLGEYGSRTLETSVVKRGALTLSKVSGQQCHVDTINGRKGRVCTVRRLSGSHQAVSAGDINFTVRAIKAPEGVLYRVGTKWNKLNEVMTLGDFRGAQSIEVFYPSKAGPQADPTTVQRLEGVFYSTSRKRFGDEFVIPVGRKSAVNEQVTGRASILTVVDKPTSTTYITTLNRSHEQSVFGSWPPRGPYAAAWYLNTYRSPIDEIASVSNATPAELFGDLVHNGNKVAMTFSTQAGQHFQQGIIGGQQLLSTDAVMVSGNKRKYQLNARKVGGITLLPATQRCQPAVVKGVKGQSCELRRIDVNAQTLKSNDIRFRLSARLPYAIQNQSRYQVGHSGWVELGSPVALDVFTQGGSIALFVPGDAVVALTSPRAVSGEFSSRSRGRMGDRTTISMMPKGSAPTAEVKERLTLAVLHDEVTQSRYLASTSRSYGAGLYGSLTDPAQPVIWQVSKDVSQAQPHNLRPVNLTQGFANAQGDVQRGRRAPQEGFVNPVLTSKAAEALAKVGGSLSLKMDVAQSSGHSATFNINATTRNGLTLRAPASQVCTPATIEGVEGVRCPVREVALNKPMAQLGDLQFRLTAKLGYAIQAKGRYLVDSNAYPLGLNVPLGTLAKARELALFVPDEVEMPLNQKNQEVARTFAVTGEVTSRSLPKLHWSMPMHTALIEPAVRLHQFSLGVITDKVTGNTLITTLDTQNKEGVFGVVNGGKGEVALYLGNAYKDRKLVITETSPFLLAIPGRGVDKLLINEQLVQQLLNGEVVQPTVMSINAQGQRERVEIKLTVARQASLLPFNAQSDVVRIAQGLSHWKGVEFCSSQHVCVGAFAEQAPLGVGLLKNSHGDSLRLSSGGAAQNRPYFLSDIINSTLETKGGVTINLDGKRQNAHISCQPGACETGVYFFFDGSPNPAFSKLLTEEGVDIDIKNKYSMRIESTLPASIVWADRPKVAGQLDIDSFQDILPGNSNDYKNFIFRGSTHNKDLLPTDMKLPDFAPIGQAIKGTFNLPTNDVFLRLKKNENVSSVRIDGQSIMSQSIRLASGVHTIEFTANGLGDYFTLELRKVGASMSEPHDQYTVLFNVVDVGPVDFYIDFQANETEQKSFIHAFSIGQSASQEMIYYRYSSAPNDIVDLSKSKWVSGQFVGPLNPSGVVTLPPLGQFDSVVELYPLSGKTGIVSMDFSLKPDFSDCVTARVAVGSSVPPPADAVVSAVDAQPSMVTAGGEVRVKVTLDKPAPYTQPVFVMFKPFAMGAPASIDDIDPIISNMTPGAHITDAGDIGIGSIIVVKAGTNEFSFTLKTLQDGDSSNEAFLVYANEGTLFSDNLFTGVTIKPSSPELVSGIDTVDILSQPVEQAVALSGPLIPGQQVAVQLDSSGDQYLSKLELCTSTGTQCQDIDFTLTSVQTLTLPKETADMFIRWTPIKPPKYGVFGIEVSTVNFGAGDARPKGTAITHSFGSVTNVTATPDNVTEGGGTNVELTLDGAIPVPRTLFVTLNLGSDPSSMIESDDIGKTLTDLVGARVVGTTTGGGSLPIWKLEAIKDTTQVSFVVTSTANGDAAVETFEVGANTGDSVQAPQASSPDVSINPSQHHVTSVDVDSTSVKEGETLTAKVKFDNALASPSMLWVGLKPTSDTMHMIEKEDISLGAITGGSMQAASLDGLSWVILVDSNVSEVSLPFISTSDGDIEDESFVVAANPGAADIAIGQVQSSEVTLMPAASLPTLTFTNKPTPGQVGQIGSAPLELNYELTLKAGTVIPPRRGASDTAVAMHVLQRAALALKLKIELTGVHSETVDGHPYCTLDSSMGLIAVPLTLKQGYGGNEKSLDCANVDPLELTAPSSGRGWANGAALNEYKTMLSAIATMDNPVSDKTVSGGLWFGDARANGTLNATVSME